MAEYKMHISMTQIQKFVFGRVENIVEKAGPSHVSKGIFLSLVEVRIVCQRIKVETQDLHKKETYCCDVTETMSKVRKTFINESDSS